MTQQTQQPTSQPSRPTNSRPSSTGRPSKGNKQRFAKGKSRYAKKTRGNAKPAARKPVGPVFTYTSTCCKVPANKPRCGQKESVVNPETKKAKDVPKGLGHWRCSACKKSCRVTVSKFKAPETVAPQENSVA